MKLKYTLLTVLTFCFITSFSQNVKKKTELRPVPIESTNSPKYRAVQRSFAVKASNPIKYAGVRGNEIIGEGEYLNFDKQILMYSATGEIPVGFPKHVIGQAKKEYVQIMKNWALQNPSAFIELSDYMNYDESIKEISTTGEIPVGFPKYKFGQSTEQYLKVMKSWGKDNLSQIKPQYWPKNK